MKAEMMAAGESVDELCSRPGQVGIACRYAVIIVSWYRSWSFIRSFRIFRQRRKIARSADLAQAIT
jgi:hypothetical protein